MSRALLAFTSAVLGGLAVVLGGRLLPGTVAPDTPIALSAPVGSGDRDAALDGLREALGEEKLHRALLEERLRRLEARLTEVAARPDGASLAHADAPPDSTPSAPAREAAGSLDVSRLEAAGFAPREIRAFRTRLDQIALERLELRDRAVREGWAGTSRFAEENAALLESLRDTRVEFGDDLYDWALYSAGHPNRVRITELMEGSPAARAGFEVGDVVERYADQKVLSPVELQQLTAQGRAGELTAVEVARGNETVRVYIPRGPLGVRIEPVTREPSTGG